MLARTLVLHLVTLISIHSALAVEADVVFVLDVSGSVAQSDHEKAVDFLYNVVNALTIGTADVQVSVLIFSDGVTEVMALNAYTDKSSLLTAIADIKNITTNGGTFTNTALNYVHVTSLTPPKGKRSNASSIVVVITDGQSQNVLQTATQADYIRDNISGSQIYAIGVGTQISTSELEHIANDPNADFLFYVTAYEYMCNLVPTLAAKIDSSASASISANCTQTTTTVWSGKGGGAAPTTTTATPTTTTAAPTTTTATPTTTIAAPTTTTAAPTTSTAAPTTTTAAPTTSTAAPTTTTAAPTTSTAAPTTTTAAPTTTTAAPTTTTAAPTTTTAAPTTTTAAPTTTTAAPIATTTTPTGTTATPTVATTTLPATTNTNSASGAAAVQVSRVAEDNTAAIAVGSAAGVVVVAGVMLGCVCVLKRELANKVADIVP